MSIKLFLLSILLIWQISVVEAAIVDQQGYPSETLLQIFRRFAPLLKESQVLDAKEIDRILDTRTPRTAISLQSLNKLAQDKFKRPDNLERYQILDTNFGQQIRNYDTPVVRTLFETLGSIKAIYPTAHFYPYLLINGSTVINMRKRLKTLVDYVAGGMLTITPNVQVIFLTGDRDLFPNETAMLLDPAPLQGDPDWASSALVQFPKNEYQAAQWIWRQSNLPPALRQAKITFVSAAKQQQFNASGMLELRRPTTLSTVKSWLRSHPKPGRCLSISNQPYVIYQEVVIQTAFDQEGFLAGDLAVEGVGDRAPDDLPLALLMDNLARTIYAMLQCGHLIHQHIASLSSKSDLAQDCSHGSLMGDVATPMNSERSTTGPSDCGLYLAAE